MKIKKGFTLIEIIVVITIIAVLAIILIPLVQGYVSQANQSTCSANFETIERDYLMRSTTDNSITLEEVLNTYVTTNDIESNNKICPICDEIEVTTSENGTELISCPSNSEVVVDNSTLMKKITSDFMIGLAKCNDIKSNTGSYSDECLLNYLGGKSYFNDGTIRESLLKEYGGTWPEFDNDTIDSINEALLLISGIDYQLNEDQYYTQPKFLSPSSDGIIKYLQFLSPTDTGYNQWNTDLLYDPQSNKYYVCDDLKVGIFYQSMSYSDFLNYVETDVFKEVLIQEIELD
jgi:prepilin-type N-terminal cleavage/methylation domain-containing protein